MAKRQKADRQILWVNVAKGGTTFDIQPMSFNGTMKENIAKLLNRIDAHPKWTLLSINDSPFDFLISLSTYCHVIYGNNSRKLTSDFQAFVRSHPQGIDLMAELRRIAKFRGAPQISRAVGRLMGRMKLIKTDFSTHMAGVIAAQSNQQKQTP